MNESEKRVVNRMITIYCHSKHKPKKGLCSECESLNCPFGANKPICGSCTIHCYKSDMRIRIKEVMRFSGPRMIFIHPIEAIRHFNRERKRNVIK